MKILICLLFRNSIFWLERFINCIDSLLLFKPNNITYHFSIIYGNSTDNTDKKLEEYIKNLNNKYDTYIKSLNLTLPKRLAPIQKLATLRNAVLYIIPNLKQYDYILSIDTDTFFIKNVIDDLIKDIKSDKSIGIIAPMVFIENFKHFKNNYFYDTYAYRIKGKNFLHIKPYIPLTENEILNINDKIIEVDSVGTMYITKTNIFTKYNVNYGTFFREDLKYESEQVYFCNEVKQKTLYKICVDTNIKVLHINLELYGLHWH